MATRYKYIRINTMNEEDEIKFLNNELIKAYKMLDESYAMMLALDEVKDIMSNAELNDILYKRELVRHTLYNLKK